jgi:hypothetical protein
MVKYSFIRSVLNTTYVGWFAGKFVLQVSSLIFRRTEDEHVGYVLAITCVTSRCNRNSRFHILESI